MLLWLPCLGHNSGMIAVNEQFMVMVDYMVLHIFCNIIKHKCILMVSSFIIAYCNHLMLLL